VLSRYSLMRSNSSRSIWVPSGTASSGMPQPNSSILSRILSPVGQRARFVICPLSNRKIRAATTLGFDNSLLENFATKSCIRVECFRYSRKADSPTRVPSGLMYRFCMFLKKGDANPGPTMLGMKVLWATRP